MGAVGVVAVEAFVEVALEGGQLRHQRAGEAGPPAFFEDGRLEPLDAAVRVGAAGLEEALAGGELFDRRPEPFRAELGAVVAAQLAEPPAGGGELAGDAVEQSRLWRALGLRSEVLSSA